MTWHEALTRVIAAEPDVQLAVLFGSAARDRSLSRSDLDVGVLGPSDAQRLSMLAVTLSRATGRQVDLVDLENAPPLLRFEVARDGKVLFARGPHLWPDFKARAMVDWWDWAPLARRLASSTAARLRAQGDHGPA